VRRARQNRGSLTVTLFADGPVHCGTAQANENATATLLNRHASVDARGPAYAQHPGDLWGPPIQLLSFGW